MTRLKTGFCLVAFCTISCFNSLRAQSLVGATGTTLNSNGYSLEYAVGEISIHTLAASGNTSFLTQGLLQPSVKVINPACDIVNDILQFFPNPTINKIRIVGRNDWITHYMIYAADGKLMATAPFVNNFIDLTRFAAGLYLVRLLPGCDGQFKTLKIVKKNL
jgi:hypothetical protein